MKIYYYFLVAVSVVLLTFFFFLKLKKNETAVPADIETVLFQKLQSMEPGTELYRQTFRSWQALRIKKDMAHVHAESPGVFENALSEIKVNRSGKTYAPNYRIKELEKAFSVQKKSRHLSKASSLLPWTERGPGNVSGRVRDILVDPDNPMTHWYIASVGGGIWKTTDAGVTWINKTPLLTTLSTMTIGMAESDLNIMYAGTGMGYGRLADLAGSGVWKSTDRGENWFQLANTANGEVLKAINRLVIDPNNPNTVVLCSNDDYTSFGPNGGQRISGIFKTTDGGTSWYQTYDPDVALGVQTDNRVQQIVANPLNFNILYATVNEVGIVKSTNAGESWFVSANNFADPTDIGFGDGTYQGISTRTEMAIAPTDTSRLYAAVERRRGTSKLFMSTNSGTTWREVVDTGADPNWFSSGGASGSTGAYCAGWFDNTIVVHPYDANQVVVGGVEVYRIVVNPVAATRQTIRIASVGQAHADHHDLVTIPIDAGTNTYWILDANDGGIAISTNGGTNWNQITGMTTSQFYGADKKKGSSEYVGGMQDNGTFYSPTDPDANTAWRRALGGDGVEVAWNYRDSALLLGGSQYGVYSRSSDGGLTWYAIPQATAGASPFVSKIASSKSDPDLVFTVGAAGINRSDDFGATWNLTPITGNWIGYRAFDNVDISIADPQVVWATSRLDLVSFIGQKGGVHVSTNGGISFTEISSNFPSNLTEPSGFGTHPIDRNTAYALFSAAGTPKVMRTTNLGLTWQDISQFDQNGNSQNGFPDVATFALLVMPFNTNIIWAGTEIGLFISNDGGTSWTLADNGIPHVGIFQMTIVDDEVVMATYGRGVWTVKLPELAGYTPPVATLSPRFKTFAQLPTGNVSIQISLNSSYDSTLVILKDQILMKLPANNSPLDTTVFFPVIADEVLSASIRSYKDGQSFLSPSKNIQVYAVTAQNAYANNFNSPTTDFVGSGFSVTTVSGFSNGAIHSTHPYSNSTQYIYQLKVPVIVSEGNSVLQYDDIALVEEGLIGTVWTDPNFFDYVVVEGTKDGFNWLPLADGYDARYNTSWSNVYNSGLSGINSISSGNSSMYVRHTLNLLNTFSPGEAIFIRFRMQSDAAAWAWGWAIDNISVNGDHTLPVLTLGALASPVVNMIRFGVGANEELSSSTVTVNSQNLTMNKYGKLFFGDYLINSPGQISVVANAFDINLNAGAPIQRTYMIAPVSKTLVIGTYSIESNGQGFIIAGLSDEGHTPTGWTRLGQTINLVSTGSVPEPLTVSMSIDPTIQLSNVCLFKLENNEWLPLATQRKEGRLYTHTSGGTIAGFYNSQFTLVPLEFALHSNYPNPFNPSTTIAYDLPKESKITLKVFNALGQEVRTLINEIRPQGFHSIQWDGRNNSGQSVASGLYIYQIQADKIVKSKKMLLLK
ncbi:T9SS type A sorting domain-containing protein [bacterium]|nr:T9SS type A sorting domain-containing protein [bacterium]